MVSTLPFPYPLGQEEILRRRAAILTELLAHDAGFDEAPDALLIDGGVEHARVALDAITRLGVSIPIFGMVKDGRHRTRALVTPEGLEIGIAATPAVFALIGSIQEETHRFAITYHRQLRSKRLQASELEKIPGVGKKRREALLKRFHSVTAIRKAEKSALQDVLGAAAGEAVWRYFHDSEETQSCE